MKDLVIEYIPAIVIALTLLSSGVCISGKLTRILSASNIKDMIKNVNAEKDELKAELRNMRDDMRGLRAELSSMKETNKALREYIMRVKEW